MKKEYPLQMQLFFSTFQQYQAALYSTSNTLLQQEYPCDGLLYLNETNISKQFLYCKVGQQKCDTGYFQLDRFCVTSCSQYFHLNCKGVQSLIGNCNQQFQKDQHCVYCDPASATPFYYNTLCSAQCGTTRNIVDNSFACLPQNSVCSYYLQSYELNNHLYHLCTQRCQEGTYVEDQESSGLCKKCSETQSTPLNDNGRCSSICSTRVRGAYVIDDNYNCLSECAGSLMKKLGTVYHTCVILQQTEIIAISCGVIFGVLAIVLIVLLAVLITRNNKRWQERRTEKIRQLLGTQSNFNV